MSAQSPRDGSRAGAQIPRYDSGCRRAGSTRKQSRWPPVPRGEFLWRRSRTVKARDRSAVSGVAAYQMQIGVIDDHLIGNRFKDCLQFVAALPHLITALTQLPFQPLLRGNVAVDGDGSYDL